MTKALRHSSTRSQIHKRYHLAYRVNCGRSSMHRYNIYDEVRTTTLDIRFQRRIGFCPLTALPALSSPPPSLIHRISQPPGETRENRSIFVSRRRVGFNACKIPSLGNSNALLPIFDRRARIYARTSVRADAHDCASHDALDPRAKRGRVNRFRCFDLAHPVYIYNARPRRIARGNARIPRSR